MLVPPTSTAITNPARRLITYAIGLRPRRPSRAPTASTSPARSSRSMATVTVGRDSPVRCAISGRVIGPSRKTASSTACSLGSRGDSLTAERSSGAEKSASRGFIAAESSFSPKKWKVAYPIS